MADASISTRPCKACANSLPETEFYSSVTRHGSIWKDRKCKRCRSEQSAQAKSRAIADPAEAERRRLWRREHKRKLRRRNGQRLRSDIAASAIARREAEAKVRAEQKARPKDHDAHVKRWRAVVHTRLRQRLRQSTPKGTIDGRMRVALGKALRGRKSGRQWESLVGYSLAELIKHLERQFIDGMSWSNMGQWHIDHIRPKSMFSYQSPDDDEFKSCWAMSNLRPMWAKDNISKGSRLLCLL